MDVTTTDRVGVGEAAPAWFAAQVWAGKEAASARQLRARGYDVFLPCWHEYRRWSDRVKKVERPLFAGYVFCCVRDDAAGKIVTTPGVIRLVNDGQRPLAVAADEIDAIRRIVDAGVAVEPWPFVRAGQRVRVCSGPLNDVEGIVLRVHNRQRLIISVSLLQRAVAVEIDAAHVTPVSDWPSTPPTRRM